MSIRWLTFAVWAAVAATAACWVGKLLPREAPRVAESAAVRNPAAAGLGRLFGAPALPQLAEAGPPPADDRFQLVGVISPRPRGAPAEAAGIALIAVDGGLPKVFAVGAVVDGLQVLQAVDARSASLGPPGGAPRRVLRLASREGEVVDPPPAGGGAGVAAASRPEAPLTAQQLFQQRQQLQFEQEEMQNRAGPGS